MSKKALDHLNAAKRALIINLLDQCTESQRDFFTKLYPEGIEKMDISKLDRAIQQCRATIDKNEH